MLRVHLPIAVFARHIPFLVERDVPCNFFVPELNNKLKQTQTNK